MIKIFATLSCIIAVNFQLIAQNTCTTRGQNPATAFPVCGTSTFTQTSVPLCGGRSVASPCKQSDQVTDINPFWYKFTSFVSGTLGFLITPKNMSSDYDWELYDITGRNVDEVYTNNSLVVASNWSGEKGLTGASSAGTQRFVCGGLGKDLFSTMPQLQKGHEYILLVSHFTQTQSGYTLSFGGGTAVITDSEAPRLQSAQASCGGDVVHIKLNKNIKCNSIAPDGSDFYITTTNGIVTEAFGINCSSKFDTDTLFIRMSGFLAPGTYQLRVKKGSDGNTLLDYCDNALPESEVLEFVILPKQPPVIKSLAPVTCAPKELRVTLSHAILCTSIASDASDFTINGTYPVSIAVADGQCPAETTKEFVIRLAEPLVTAGDFTLSVQKGTDGNTLLDECGEEMLAGQNVSFSVKDTVNADFSYDIKYGCAIDTVSFTHPGKNNSTSWQWNLDDGLQSSEQNPQALYTQFTPKKVSLVVSNGFCSATATASFNLDNYLKADFTVFEDNCPNEPVPFTGQAVGRIVQHRWTFGDGGTAKEESPRHTFGAPLQQQTYKVKYTVTDIAGCEHTAEKPVTIYSSCYLAVPTAFTPNGDGKNDMLRPLNAIKAENLEFKVFNRWGQLLYSTVNWKQGWDGKFKGQTQPSGTYVWMLRYINRDTRQLAEQKGTAVLIR